MMVKNLEFIFTKNYPTIIAMDKFVNNITCVIAAPTSTA